MRRIALPIVLVLALSLAAACGGGDDGPSEAFCEDLESLSDAIAEGDLDEQLDTIDDDLGESAADGAQLEAVENLVNDYEEADNSQEELAEEVQDELGDFAEDCDIDSDGFAVAPTTTTTTEPPETTTTEGGGDTTLPPEDNGPEVLARAEVPDGVAAEFAALADACFVGDMEACDTLFDTTPPDSVDEAYGATCGGRLADADAQPSECSSIITGPLEVPAEIVDQANAQACFAGDMVACDELFNTSPADSLDEAYGALCARRVSNTRVLCVDIFGDTAFV